MAFEKEFKEGVDFTPLEDKDGLHVHLESNTLKILNRDAYRMFVGKLIMFNDKYAEIAKNIPGNEETYKKNRLINTKFPIDIDCFYRINHRWRSIAKQYYATAEDPTGLENIKNYRPEDKFPSTQIEMLKQSTEEVYFQLSSVVEEMKLGKPYTNSKGEEKLDYTEIAHDLLELSILATHAYTDVFNILEKEYGSGAYDKMEDLARSMHSSSYNKRGYDLPRRRLAVDAASEALICNPLSVKNLFAGYPENEFLKMTYKYEEYQRKLEESLKRTPEEEEEIRKRREEHEKKEKEEDRIAEEKRKEEDRKLIEQEQAELKAQKEREHIEELHEDNERGLSAFPIVPNDPEPSKINQPMYAYFEKFADRMGIDQSKLNAQSIIQAASIAYITENTRYIAEEKIDTESFLNDMTAVCNQVSRITYAAYIEKCINEHRPIDFDVPFNEISDLMSVTMYTMYPKVVSGEKTDFSISGAIDRVVNGYTARHDINTRAEAMELARLAYLDKPDAFFTADAEARFEGFTTQKRSSDSIVEETAAIVNSYNQYKKNRVDPDPQINPKNATAPRRTAFGEGEMRKKAMDAAYALEKRIETRYKSRLSRFFRYFSYSKQKEELAREKAILGVPQDQRVASYIKSYRIDDIFVDANHKNSNKAIDRERQTRVGADPKKYIIQLLEKNLGKDNIPNITDDELKNEIHTRYIRFQEMTPAALAYEKAKEEERLRQEEEARILKEQEEERLRKEEEEKISQEPEKQENLNENADEYVEEDAVEEEQEPLITEEEYAKKVYEAKEKLFEDKIKVITANLNASEKLRKSKEDERNRDIEKNKDIFAQMEKEANDLREANNELNSQIYFLQEQISEMSKQLGDRALENTNLEEQALAEAKEKSSFFSKVGSVFTSQKTKDEEAKKEAEKAEARDESKKAVKLTKGVLDGLTEELSNYVAQVQLNTQKADKLDNDKWIYENRAAKLKTDLSNVELDAAKEVKSYQRKIDDLMKNKEKIIESGEDLNFDENLFKKNLMEALAAERKVKEEVANKANDGEANVNENEQEKKERISIGIDESEKNAPIEPKKEELSKEEISLQK
ncbi:MAG: hypothetical protein J6Q78_02745 [Clostridia bacterium]|nr:hypothetical protein [Clostridia bacterium]